MQKLDNPDKINQVQKKQSDSGGFFAAKKDSSFFGNGKTKQGFFSKKSEIVQQKQENKDLTEMPAMETEESMQKQDTRQLQSAPVPPAGTGGSLPPTGATTTTTAAETCSPEADTAKKAFLAGTYGPRSVVPPLDGGTAGYGGFEAQYIPATQTLNIKVRGKIQFMDGLTGTGVGVSSTASDYAAIANIIKTMPPDAQGELLPYFQWSAAAKAAALAQFRTQLAGAVAIWQNTGMYFQVNETCWDDVRANPRFSLEVTEEGTASYNASTDAAGTTTVDPTSDHLQVKIFKSPTPAEQGAITAKIAELERQGKIPCFVNNNPNTELRAYVDGDRAGGGYANANAHDNDMYLSSNDLNNMPDGERGGSNMLRHTVYFSKDSAVVSPADAARVRAFLERFKQSGDTNSENNAINLIGFASAEGSTEYNTALVERRLQAVRDVVSGFGVRVGNQTRENVSKAIDDQLGLDAITDPLAGFIGDMAGDAAEQDVNGRIRTDNRSDFEAEADPTLDPANERRVELRIGSGERQNTLAHEFGHVFGLADEYTEGDRGAGKEAGHSEMAKKAGVTAGAQTENSDNIISMGNTVRPQHYAPFANALNQLTGKTWHVKS